MTKMIFFNYEKNTNNMRAIYNVSQYVTLKRKFPEHEKIIKSFGCFGPS